MYSLLERIVPRTSLWKIGRFLYQGARRELLNDPHQNGEYALIEQLAPYWQKADGELVFFDVGANFADWSVKLLAQLGTAGARAQITAFEPAPAQAERAEQALAAADSYGRSHLERSAVGAHCGEVSFAITGDDTGNSAIAAGGDNAGDLVTVPCTTLDAFAGDSTLPIRMIKVDTEGNDSNVIEGAKALFAARQIEILQFEYNSCWIAFHRTLRDVFEMMRGTGYSIGVLSHAGIEIYDEWHPELERFFETNFVLLRDDLVGVTGAKRMTFGAGNVPVPG